MLLAMNDTVRFPWSLIIEFFRTWADHEGKFVALHDEFKVLCRKKLERLVFTNADRFAFIWPHHLAWGVLSTLTMVKSKTVASRPFF